MPIWARGLGQDPARQRRRTKSGDQRHMMSCNMQGIVVGTHRQGGPIPRLELVPNCILQLCLFSVAAAECSFSSKLCACLSCENQIAHLEVEEKAVAIGAVCENSF